MSFTGGTQQFFPFAPGISPIIGPGAVTGVTATLPIISSGGTTPNISLQTPLPIIDGGTGTATPSLIAGTNVTIIGAWPNQVIIAAGGSGVTSVTASSPLASSGGPTPNISIASPLPVANGGNGTATPSLIAGTNVTITGAWPAQTINATVGGGGVASVTGTGNILSSGGTNPNITTVASPTFTNITATGSVHSGPGGINLGYVNVQDYLSQNIGQLTASIVVPNVGSNVTVPITTLTGTFANGQSVSVWDYQYCFSGTIVSGGGSSTLVVHNVQMNGSSYKPTTAGVTLTNGTGSSAWGIQSDDGPGIAVALAVAAALPDATLYFPDGQYVTSQTLTLAPRTSVHIGGSASIRPAGTVQDCFTFSTGGGGGQFDGSSIHEIPSAFYFPGAAMSITDNNISYLNIHQDTVQDCGWGLRVTANNNGSTGTFGIYYYFKVIQACTYAYQQISNGGSRDGVQGLVMKGTIIIGCQYSNYFVSNNRATATVAGATLNLTSFVGNRFHNGDTLYVVDAGTKSAALVTVTSGGGTSAINFSVNYVTPGGSFPDVCSVVPFFSSFGNNVFDVDGVNGNAPSTWGIVYDGGVFNQNYFRSTSSWGAFGTNQYLTVSNSGLGYNSCYDFQLFAAAGTLAIGYGDFVGLRPPPGTSNFISASNVFRTAFGGASPTILDGRLTPAASTSAGSRGAFNGGVPITSQRFPISMVTGTPGGSILDFYVYSPFTTGSTANISFVPGFDTSTAPFCFFTSIADQSHINPNEIRIRVTTPTTFVGTSQTIYGTISVGM